MTTPFAEKVYAVVRRIPRGRVATYGQVAEILGSAGSARAVGNALHVNPYAPEVPCHRVVAADGSLAANFGCGGPEVQRQRLLDEGVAFTGSRVDLNRCGIVIERHPLQPFLPENGRILFLGSFPPPRARWSMEFFYPNWINDFWRIQGLNHYGDVHHFELPGEKRFDRLRIIDFCNQQGLAFYDTAAKVCRWKGNASDEFLEILEPADIPAMLSRMPLCHTLVTTGGKSAEELLTILQGLCDGSSTPENVVGEIVESIPAVGHHTDIHIAGRPIRWWRMPSTSRAYPLPLSQKAAQYARLEVQ